LDSINEKTQVIIRRIVILPGRAEAGVRQQCEILKAMCEGDADRAEAMRRHNIRDAKACLKQYLKYILSRTATPAMHSASIMPLAIRHLDGWRIRTPHGTALVARQGAQLLSYTPAGEPPLVWLSERAHFTPGRPMRGGVPVCWPWFGAYARNPPAVRDSVGAPADAPSHGWVRQADWHLVAQRVEADAAELELGFDAPPGCAPGWRHDARLVLRIRCGRQLSLALSVHNRGAQACTTAL